MSAAATSLTDFLLARIAEDEAAVRGAVWREGDYSVFSYLRKGDAAHVAQLDPPRALRECGFKADLVQMHSVPDDSVYDADGVERPLRDCDECFDIWPCATIRRLALIYKTHPDWREGWRP